MDDILCVLMILCMICESAVLAFMFWGMLDQFHD